jgi:membrane-associated protease RseP (regulator of RpoE activity)
MKNHWMLMGIIAGMTTLAAAVGPQQPAPAPMPKAKILPRIAMAAPAAAFYGGEETSGSYLGVDIKEITADRVAPLKLKEERGVEVLMVDQDAPAGKAGLRERDVILDFNGQRVEGHEQLSRMLRETPPGRTVTLGISRDGQPQQLKVTLASRKEYVAKVYKDKMMKVKPRAWADAQIAPQVEMPAIDVVVRSYSRATGMMVDNLTPQLGEFFGVKSGEGVLVRSVEKGSVAEAAGIRAGDVIVKVDDDRIADRNDFNRTLRRKEGKASVVVVRDKREQTFSINVPPRRRSGSDDESFMRWPDFEIDGFDFDFESEPEELDRRINHAFSYAAPQFQAALPRLVMDNTFPDFDVEFDTDFDMDWEPMLDSHSPCPEARRL